MRDKVPDTELITSPWLNPGDELMIDSVYGSMTELLTGKIARRERADENIASAYMGGYGVHAPSICGKALGLC